MNFQTSVKKINKQLNYDLKIFSNWLNANKLFLNPSKTEHLMFNPSKKQLDLELKIKLNGKQLYQTDSVKNLGIHTDKTLIQKCHMNIVAIKINKEKAMLSKIRYYVDRKTLKSIYHAYI